MPTWTGPRRRPSSRAITARSRARPPWARCAASCWNTWPGPEHPGRRPVRTRHIERPSLGHGRQARPAAEDGWAKQGRTSTSSMPKTWLRVSPSTRPLPPGPSIRSMRYGYPLSLLADLDACKAMARTGASRLVLSRFRRLPHRAFVRNRAGVDVVGMARRSPARFLMLCTCATRLCTRATCKVCKVWETERHAARQENHRGVETHPRRDEQLIHRQGG